MLKKILSGMAIAAMMAVTVAPTAAVARDRGNHHGWHKNKHHHSYNNDRYRDYRRPDYRRDDSRYYSGYSCKRHKGNGGLVIGAISGGLLGQIGTAACRGRGGKSVGVH